MAGLNPPESWMFVDAWSPESNRFGASSIPRMFVARNMRRPTLALQIF